MCGSYLGFGCSTDLHSHGSVFRLADRSQRGAGGTAGTPPPEGSAVEAEAGSCCRTEGRWGLMEDRGAFRKNCSAGGVVDLNRFGCQVIISKSLYSVRYNAGLLRFALFHQVQNRCLSLSQKLNNGSNDRDGNSDGSSTDMQLKKHLYVLVRNGEGG